MRWWLLMLVCGVHVVAAAASAVILTALHFESELALVVAAIVGAQVGAWVYHKRHPEPAPASVKAAIGGIMALMCVIETLLAQLLWHWKDYPEVVIPFCAIGTFIFPFIVFGTMQRAAARAEERKKAQTRW